MRWWPDLFVARGQLKDGWGPVGDASDLWGSASQIHLSGHKGHCQKRCDAGSEAVASDQNTVIRMVGQSLGMGQYAHSTTSVDLTHLN